MGNNVIYELSKKFAIRIIKLYVFSKKRNMNSLCLNKYTDVVQA